MDVNNGFFMVECELPANREKIMLEGLWMLFDHYLAVARCTPDLASPLAKVEKTLVWIRFSGLNLLYYDESVFIGLAFIVGTRIKVNVNVQWYNVQYEAFHIICSSCGCYEHHTRDCKKPPDNMTQSIVPTMSQPRGLLENDVVHEKRLELHQKMGEDSVEVVAKESGEINAVHDDWLVVQKKKHNKRINYCQGKYLSYNVPRDPGSSKIKGIDVSLKGISVDSKTIEPNQLGAIFKKR
ncbi:hypothetical protein KIW84_011284 [Lathyrus oleraceus]|uniref:DUF4283 domain-containing protein n=1 Tax=Pisum sativum TaxID=3888 RepID=A0A9D4YM34_PEA|nr:hypothetical protein KIW84_011284 [Pisum sativum]